MTNSYLDLVKQTFNFPQEGIVVEDGNLTFNGLDLTTRDEVPHLVLLLGTR